MYHSLIAQAVLATSLLATVNVPHIILSNDDGWATAQIRAQFDALVDAGYQVRSQFNVTYHVVSNTRGLRNEGHPIGSCVGPVGHEFALEDAYGPHRAV